MHEAFLKNFYPNRLATNFMRQFKTLSQKENEPFVQAWERFKDLQLQCPYHTFEKWLLISFFYNGLSPKAKKSVKIICQGEFFGKTDYEAEQHFEWLAEHTLKWEFAEPKIQSKQKSIF